MSYTDADISGVDEDSLRLYRWNGTAWNNITGSNVNTTENYVYANVTSFSQIAPFGNETIPPTVTSESPADGATGIAITATISATFSEAMNTASAQSAFSISPSVSGTFSWGGNKMTFTPGANLAYSTKYTVTINASIAKDLAGNFLDGNANGAAEGSPTDDYTWSFTTGSAPTPTPTPPPRGDGGSGGGSGGGATGSPPPAIDWTPVSTDATGEVKSTVTATSADAKASVTIPCGIIAKDAAGRPLSKVAGTPVALVSTLYAVPSGVNYVAGYAYNFGPMGATFSKPIEISITFDPADFEGKTPVIYTYEAGTWKALATTVDWANNKATTRVTHFSIFVLFAEERVEVTPPPIPPTPTPTTATPVISPADTPTATPTPSSVNETNATAAVGESKGLLIYIVIGIGIVVASLFVYNKFGKGRQSRKEQKEGEGGKPSAEVSDVQKGRRKEWT